MGKNEQEICKGIENIKTTLNISEEILLIYYNPSIENSMKKNDEKWLTSYLECLNFKRCLVIPYGIGGNTKTGILMTYLLRRKFDRYSLFPPFSACSSLSYFVLKADKLYMGEKTVLSQIDPIMEYGGEEIRLIKLLNEKEHPLHLEANNNFIRIREIIFKMLSEQPSIIKKRKKTLLYEDEIEENIVDLFLNKKEHCSNLTFGDFKNLNMNVCKIEDNNINMEELYKSMEVLFTQLSKYIKEKGNLLITTTGEMKDPKTKLIMNKKILIRDFEKNS